MRTTAINKRLAILEEGARPRILITLADFVVWHAKWRLGIKEEVEIAPLLESALRGLAEKEPGAQRP
jgi:hypothetical protein